MGIICPYGMWLGFIFYIGFKGSYCAHMAGTTASAKRVGSTRQGIFGRMASSQIWRTAHARGSGSSRAEIQEGVQAQADDALER
jgi:hypothetical protein